MNFFLLNGYGWVGVSVTVLLNKSFSKRLLSSSSGSTSPEVFGGKVWFYISMKMTGEEDLLKSFSFLSKNVFINSLNRL